MAGVKPMYNKYFDVWKTHTDLYGPRTAVLYQVGGFFEIYDVENLVTGTTRANIRDIADVCQLSLATNDIGDGCQSLFGGFPDHALAKFERTLVLAGFTVVVVVQKKGRGGNVEERLVDHISSPGCFVEGVKDRRLIGAILERGYWAAAAIDVATGSIWFVEGADTDRDRLHQFLCTYPPSELVLWTDGLSAITESLKSACETVHIRCLGTASVALDESILVQFWSRPIMLAATQCLPQGRRCLAALMDFARDHMPLALKDLRPPIPWLPTDEVRLGNAALEQLGVLSFKNTKQSLLGILDSCRSVGGKRLLRSRLTQPTSNVATLRHRLAEFTKTHPPETERHLRSLYDTSRIFRRLELGTATLVDMGCLLRSWTAALSLIQMWRPEELEVSSYLTTVLGDWNLDALCQETITNALPFVNPGVDTATLFAEGQSLRAEVEALCSEGLYIEDVDGGGFRITGTKRRLAAAHAALRDNGDTTAVLSLHRTTSILETASLLDVSARHREWFSRWSLWWALLWARTIQDFVVAGRDFHRRIEVLCAEIDVIWTISGIAKEWGWTNPVYVESEDSWVQATGLRHPMIEQLLTQVPYVAQDISLAGDETGLLLYGMNASGKSSLMKAVGLCTVLAQTGFPVPAASFTLAPFTAIFTRILGNDNLWAGQSSFVVEMTEFRDVLRFADNRSLILGDELCSGTESLSATALVAAGVETLASRKAKFLFATHLHELGSLGLGGVKVAHLAVHYDEATGSLVYDRTLKPGSGSALYGLEVCRALDMPTAFIERALQIRQGLVGDQKAHVSPYSSESVVSRCEVCGSSAGLETHHIQHQATFQGPTAALHAPHNLTTLCGVCHDDHHAGRLAIKGWEDTTEGRRLLWSRPGQVSVLDSDVVDFIRMEKALKKRVLTIQRVVKTRFGLDVTKTQITQV